MEKIYNPKAIEFLTYNIWEKNGYFLPHGDTSKDSFFIAIPPPNITGGLHMGHAFQYTIMDILIRYNRMLGKNTLWQMGLDHAGIATQILVEKKIFKEERKNKFSYSKYDFLKKIWQWKKESETTIFYQMRRLGSSVDWSTTKFTLDESISNAVTEAFIKLYNDKLIYKGKKITNWDHKLNSVISDLEVEMRTVNSSMWFIKYKIVNSNNNIKNNQYLTVATTRPETLLGDTAIAIHSEDERYQYLKGKKVIVPIINRIIPIIFDNSIDKTKGTGCVKITPAHDFHDYNIGMKHKLPMISIFGKSLIIKKKLKVYTWKGNNTNVYDNDIPIELHNLNKEEARKKIVFLLKKFQFLEKVIKYETLVPHGDRSGSVIEPILTNQWYIKMKPLSKVAIEAVKNKKILFIPSNYEKLYYSWMNNIEDWCISRQVVWGHRLPIWYDKQGNHYVGKNEKSIKELYYLSDTTILIQEKNVLDTWFSSALWTFASLGWPRENNLLNIFHPSNVLVSGFDIIFFWISRMIMLTMYFIKNQDGTPQIPFKIAYITGLIRDDKGQKMSKSKGNVLDPIDMIDGISLSDLIKKRTENLIKPQLINEIKHRTITSFPNGIEPTGSDALRLTFASLSAPTRNINWDMNRLRSYRNFCNKIWNATRLILMLNIHQHNFKFIKFTDLHFFDQWIYIEYNNFIKSFTKMLTTYRLDRAISLLNVFFKNNFCDWYIEIIKVFSKDQNNKIIISMRYSALKILSSLIRLIHPIIPFITEVIWQKINNIKKSSYSTIMTASYPVFNKHLQDTVIIENMCFFKKLITTIRQMRLEAQIDKKELINIYINNITQHLKKLIFHQTIVLNYMVCVRKIIIKNVRNSNHYLKKTIDTVEIFLKIDKIYYNNAYLIKINNKIKKIDVLIFSIKKKLLNKNFINKAPFDIIKKEKEKFINYIQTKSKLITEKNFLKYKK
ncbi:Valine--tRNA ligase [Buchnera aphidicola (Thelaxes suberi)]|uniref:valine--tRNA ligase n=1 Tax=Buchnera aphidicola TaxID=9 RepID=UPI003463E050